MSSISTGEWSRYLRRMRALGDRASSELERFVERSGGLAAVDRDALIEYAYGLATMFGEGATALAAEMYDGVAQRQGVTRPPAEPAPTATVSEVARAVNGTCKSGNAKIVGQSIGRAVRLAGMDTTMKNAMRDGAEFAWIPSGDTCAFCMMLASNGWQRASKKTLKGDHCEHIHANCDCAFAIRFGDDLEYASYDPTPYKEMYDNAEGDNWEEKLNSMRRDVYAERSEDINAQKRAAYAAAKERDIREASLIFGEPAIEKAGEDGIISGGQGNASMRILGSSIDPGQSSDEICDAIVANHEALKDTSPESMKTMLEKAGFDVKPLSRGNYKGVPFEKGGGYKITFGGDGVFQYHPEKRSHHNGAYWKVKNGKQEHRYDMDGNEI